MVPNIGLISLFAAGTGAPGSCLPDAHSADNPKSERLHVKLPVAAENMGAAWQVMETELQQIERAGYDYDTLTPDALDENNRPYAQNSNSIVAAMMKMAGLDMKKYLPKELTPEQVPGMNNALDHEPEAEYDTDYKPGAESYDPGIWGDGGDPTGRFIEKDWRRKVDPLADPTITDPPGAISTDANATDGAQPGAFFNAPPPALGAKLLKSAGHVEDVLSHPVTAWGAGDVRAVMAERMGFGSKTRRAAKMAAGSLGVGLLDRLEEVI